MTRTRAEYRLVVDALAAGLTDTETAARTGVPRRTVLDWRRGRIPRAFIGLSCGCADHAFDSLPGEYAYLLAMYLGDGYLARHRRGVRRLRISLDARYPEIIEEARSAIGAVMPGRSAGVQDLGGHVEVYAYARRWLCLLPQDGPGMKHQRPIELTRWQVGAVRRNPELFLRGLIHSDGCRSINTGTNWRHPRYSFSNRSDDILGLFEWGCEILGLHYTRAPYTVYVSRKVDVARMDEFIGPKR